MTQPEWLQRWNSYGYRDTLRETGVSSTASAAAPSRPGYDSRGNWRPLRDDERGGMGMEQRLAHLRAAPDYERNRQAAAAARDEHAARRVVTPAYPGAVAGTGGSR